MSESINFEIQSDLSTINPQHIETNFEAVRDWLERELAPYTRMAVTEDALSTAKDLRARIRKMRDSINGQKIAAKKQWLRPFEEYESQCKTLMGLCDEALGNIDSQCKAFEQERRDRKISGLKAFFDSVCAEKGCAGYLRWEKVLNPRWGNAGYKEDDARKEIGEAAEKAAQDLDYIRGMHSPYEAAMLDTFREAGELRAALEKGRSLQALAEAEERRRNAEIEKEIPASAKGKGETDSLHAPSAPIYSPVQPVKPCAAEQVPPKIYTLRFSVTCEYEQMMALKKFLNDNNIRYSRI